ncbi:hypothetical protein [Azospirillum sp. B506]|uniref:hypothetical protein n=1 Tax=Azospirillum sp. B506 TaxID=137721 RepID=UPI0003468BA8|nr:hypothetical protein [Azospirillum sp. B506]
MASNRTAALQLIGKIREGRALDTLLRQVHSAPAVVALTDSTGGSANNTLQAVGATNGSDQSAAINNNFADISAKVNELIAAFKTAGLLP